jgi:hypothetical protein
MRYILILQQVFLLFFFVLVASAAAVTAGVFGERNKKWHMEMMMEKLRSKIGQYKSFAENTKALKNALLVRIKEFIILHIHTMFIDIDYRPVLGYVQ